MAMNLVEQQNVLRDLTDDMLQQAMQGGIAPPYLVLAEVNRRKDARERYAAQKAKYDANQATVAQDVMQQLAQATQAAQGAAPAAPMGIAGAVGAPEMPASSGGLDAAMPSEAPAFADGGPVMKYADGMSVINPSIITSLMTGSPAAPGPAAPAQPRMSTALPSTIASFQAQLNNTTPFQYNYPAFQNPYGSLMDLYNSQLQDISKQREQARAMALIAAGTGMMQGGPNTLKNIGAAFGPAMQGYQSQIDSVNQAERDLLAGRVNAQIAGSAAEKAARKEYEDSPQGRIQMAEALGYKPGDREYEQLLVNGTIPSTSGGSYETRWGRDASGQVIAAQYNRRTGQFFDTSGAEIPGFEPLSDADLAQRKKELMGKPTQQGFRSEMGALDVNVGEAKFNQNSVQKAIDFVNDPNRAVGGLADITSGIPGTDANRLKSLISTVKANTAFGNLQQLREQAAATGAIGSGLGQVTQNEMRLLEDAIATVETSNRREDIAAALITIRDKYNSIIENMKRMAALVHQEYISNVDPNSPEGKIVNRLGLNTIDFDVSTDEAIGGGGGIPDPLGMR